MKKQSFYALSLHLGDITLKALQRMIRIHRTLFATALFLLFLCTTGCAGDRIEHDPADQRLIGKLVRFSQPMAYMLLSEKDLDDFDKEAVRTGRLIMSKRDLVDRFSVFYDYPREYFKDGMIFTIVGAYWVRQGWIEREFASDAHMVILKDENGILSVCEILDIDSINADFRGVLK